MAIDTIPIKDALDATHNIYVEQDSSGNKTQIIKNAFGAEDADPVLVSTSNPMPTVQTGALPAGTNNIGDVDVLTLPADPLGANADAAATAGGTGSISAKLRLTTSLLNSIFNEIQNVTVTEDGVHTNGDLGIMPLGVRKDVGGTLASADGDYTPPQFDASGNLRVNVAAGSAAVTQYTEGDTDATISGVAMLWEDASDTLRAVSAANPLPTELVSGTVSLTGGVDITADAEVVQVTPTITAGAYSANDVVGGQQTFSNAMRESGRGAVLQNVTIMDKGNQKSEFDLYFFNSSSTIQADNVGFTWNSADFTKFLGWVHVPGGVYDADTNPYGYREINSESFCTVPAGFVVYGNGTANLFMAVVTKGTPTYTSTSDLLFSLGLLRD